MLRPRWAYALLLSGIISVAVALFRFLPRFDAAVRTDVEPKSSHSREQHQLIDVRAAIEHGNLACSDALKRGDAEAYADNFIDDSISMPGLGPIVRGRDGIRSAMIESFKKVRFDEAEVQSLELRVAGDVAYEAGNYRFIVTNGNGRPQTLTGRYLVVWKRDHDRWRIAVDAAQPGAPAA